MTINLPKLEKIYWERNGNKNVVKQLIVPEKKIDYNFVSSHRGYSIIEANGIKYCLVRNENSGHMGGD